MKPKQRLDPRDPSGAVLVLFAASLSFIIPLSIFVIDVGNWFVHRQHLQTQADAGALAAASRFRAACVFPVTPLAIEREVGRYSSVAPLAGDPSYNPQIGTTSACDLHAKINSKTFFNQTTKDDTDEGSPCATSTIDLKLTETDLPWFLKAAKVDFINAQARVEAREKNVDKGSLPIAVEEVGPQKVFALYVDESTGTELFRSQLLRRGSSGGLNTWTNVTATPAQRTISVDRARIGVRILLSGTTAVAPNCGDVQVTCFGGPGLVRIRGYNATSTAGATAGNPPIARKVEVLPGDANPCEDGYFTARPTVSPCNVKLSADVDFGTNDLTGLRVQRKVGSLYPELAPPTTPGGPWTSEDISIAAGSNATTYDLRWQSGCPAPRNATCSGTNAPTATGPFADVHKTWAGAELATSSGSIKSLRVTEGTTFGATAFPSCSPGCTHDLVITLGLRPAFNNDDGADATPTSLKASSGGQTGSTDCDPALSFDDEFALGCGPTYKQNDGSVTCAPDQTGTNTYFTSTAQPWQCVRTESGNVAGPTKFGLNQRIYGAKNYSGPCLAADANKWPVVTAGDKRIVKVLLTRFGALTGNPKSIPVTGFATFYVTDWGGGACPSPTDTSTNGEVLGHFIAFIDPLNDGSAGETACDFDSLATCTAVLTR